MNDKKIKYIIIPLFVIFCITIYMINKGTFSTDNPSRIHFISTGESNAFLIESNGHYGLIDASNAYNDDLLNYQYEGWSINKVTSYLDTILGSNIKLDFILATHAHSDHIGGMPIIAQKYVNSGTKYYYRTYVPTNEDTEHTDWYTKQYYNRAISAMTNANVNLIEITNNNIEFTFQDLNIKFINTESWESDKSNGYITTNDTLAYHDNANSIGTIITRGKTKIFLASDIEQYDEPKVANIVGKVDVLQMGHHGMNSATTYDFMNVLQPQYVIVPNIKSLERTEETNQFSFANTGSKAYMIDNFNTTIYATTEYSYITNPEKVTAQAIILNINANNYDWELSNNQNISLLDMSSFINQQNGWFRISNEDRWVYLENGSLVKNTWKKDSSNYWYYLDNDGATAIGDRTIYSETYNKEFEYTFNNKSRMVTGWVKANNNNDWYYYATAATEDYPGGAKVYTDWIEDNSNWYYFGSDALMATGLIQDDGHTYYLNEVKTDSLPRGAMITGWKELDGYYYYFNKTTTDELPKGAMVTGWLNDNSKWYYLDTDGKMLTGTHYLDDGNGNMYYYTFDETGAYVSKEEEITYNITYDLKDGTVDGNPTTYTVNSADITLINPTKTGYTFTGWTGSNGNKPQKTVTITKGSTGDKNYIANWSPNTNTKYIVKHYIYDNDAYTLYQEEELYGTTDANLNINNLKKEITNYTFIGGYTSGDTTKPTTNPITTTTILPDGSRTISMYYLKNEFSINNHNISNNIIYNITVGTSAEELINDVTANNGNVIVTDKEGNEIATDQVLKTGYRLKIIFNNDDNTSIEYPISIKGDILGEGHPSLAGAKKVAKHIIEGNILTDEYLLAADMDSNGKIKMNDVIKMLK